MRSPAWNDKELKLVLELYLSKDLEWLAKIHDSTEEVVALSQLLNLLAIYPDTKPDNFRSVGSVRMKLANFKSLDTRYGKSSLSNISSRDRYIWEQYSGNYSQLFAECKDILNGYKFTNVSECLVRYLAKFKNAEMKFDSFFSFANNTFKFAEDFRIKALETSDLEMSKKIADTCFKVMESLEWCVKPTHIQSYKKEMFFKEHGGINMAPIVNNQIKIGKYVQNAIAQLIAGGFITEKVLMEVTDENWSKRVLHIGHSFFKSIDIHKDLKAQLLDSTGYLRYWKEIYYINDKAYCVCKEWYESGRKYFDNWMNSVLSATFWFEISADNLKIILKYIKETDEQKLSIKLEDIYSRIWSDKKKETIDIMLKVGLLIPFHGDEKELVVEDYDLLYAMLGNPELYVKGETNEIK